MSQAEFVDTREECALLRDHSEEDYRAAFERVDIDNSGVLELNELRLLLRELLGREPSPLQLTRFEVEFDKNRDGRISWEELRAGLPRVLEKLEKETTVRPARGQAPQTRVGALAPEVIGSEPLLSRTHLDMGRYGDMPTRRPLLDRSTHALAGTTRDLEGGTTHTTRHIPGYSGFMPSHAARGSKAAEQGFGEAERSTFHAKTNLMDTASVAPLGYTGHVPTQGLRRLPPQKPRGQFAPTDQAAADSIVEQYWISRARAARGGGREGGEEC